MGAEKAPVETEPAATGQHFLMPFSKQHGITTRTAENGSARQSCRAVSYSVLQTFGRVTFVDVTDVAPRYGVIPNI